MKLTLGFGDTPQTVELPDENVKKVLTPNEVEIGIKGEAAVRVALQHPIGSRRLSELVSPGEKIVLITSDITRPLPSYKLLPPVLEELMEAGCKLADITIVFALGSHRRHSSEEMKRLVGQETYYKVRCVDSDSSDFVHMGQTRHGTPVDITRVVAEADRRIGLGNVEYHYFAGYSGGAKAIMPGVSTRAAIQANHSRMVELGAVAGRMEGNPVRADLEEAIAFCPLDFIVNVVLDEHKEIIHASAGHFIHAHRVSCRFLDQIYRKSIPEKADIVLCSQGGAPKDINLYQTQKALDNAKHAVKPGGVIVLVGSCKEGFGEKVFEEWMRSAQDPKDMIERIRTDFQLGGHKAAAIAMVLEEAEIYLVSELPPELVREIFLTPFSTAQEAMDAAFAKYGADATVLVMPYGGSTLPIEQQWNCETR